MGEAFAWVATDDRGAQPWIYRMEPRQIEGRWCEGGDMLDAEGMFTRSQVPPGTCRRVRIVLDDEPDPTGPLDRWEMDQVEDFVEARGKAEYGWEPYGFGDGCHLLRRRFRREATR